MKSSGSLQSRRKAAREKNRLKRRAMQCAHLEDSSCSSAAAMMNKYRTTDPQPNMARFGFRDPCRPTEPFLQRLQCELQKYSPITVKLMTGGIPISQHVPISSQQTPDPAMLCQETPATQVRRQLFTSSPPLHNEDPLRTTDKVKSWLEKCKDNNSLYDSPDQASQSTEECEKYGFPLPSWLPVDDTGPKLVKNSQNDIFKDSNGVSKDNHAIIKKWLQDCAVKRAVGDGQMEEDKQAIQPSHKTCKFADSAGQVIDNLPPVQRYPLQKYIGELQRKEEEAIATARMYRDKWEEANVRAMEVSVEAKKKELNINTFWRKNIAEQCVRGGKILNMSLSSKKVPSSRE